MRKQPTGENHGGRTTSATLVATTGSTKREYHTASSQQQASEQALQALSASGLRPSSSSTTASSESIPGTPLQPRGVPGARPKVGRVAVKLSQWALFSGTLSGTPTAVTMAQRPRRHPSRLQAATAAAALPARRIRWHRRHVLDAANLEAAARQRAQRRLRPRPRRLGLVAASGAQLDVQRRNPQLLRQGRGQRASCAPAGDSRSDAPCTSGRRPVQQA